MRGKRGVRMNFQKNGNAIIGQRFLLATSIIFAGQYEHYAAKMKRVNI